VAALSLSLHFVHLSTVRHLTYHLESKESVALMATPKRTASDVIEHAINENRFGEHLLYLFSCTSIFVGLGVLGYGAYQGQSITAVLGTVASLMFYPAMRLAKGIRAQNMAIRLMEIPLNNSKTAEEAANVLRQFFESTIHGKQIESSPNKEITKS